MTTAHIAHEIGEIALWHEVETEAVDSEKGHKEFILDVEVSHRIKWLNGKNHRPGMISVDPAVEL